MSDSSEQIQRLINQYEMALESLKVCGTALAGLAQGDVQPSGRGNLTVEPEPECHHDAEEHNK